MITPSPKWIPEHFEEPIIIEELVKTFTDNSRAFVVFSTGTVIISKTTELYSDQQYIETLSSVVHQHPDFRVMPLKGNKYMVGFAGPVYGIVDGDMFDANSESIVANLKSGGLIPGEVISTNTEENAIGMNYFIGLYARAKLYRDFKEMQIALRYSPLNQSGPVP